MDVDRVPTPANPVGTLLAAIDDIIENAPPQPQVERPSIRPRSLLVLAAVLALVAGGWFAFDRLTASEPAPPPARTTPLSALTSRPIPTPRATLPAGLSERALQALERRPGFVTAISTELIPGDGDPLVTVDETVGAGHYLVDLLCLGHGSVLVSLGDPDTLDSLAAPSARVPCASGPDAGVTREVTTTGAFAVRYVADDGTLGAFAWAVSRV